ncbi:MAG: hypothetical protein SVY10_20365 [Thermodesulfobacteriota bacterium]|nr:hypothetical protein [Thermodesulfobacteriota bacterium]
METFAKPKDFADNTGFREQRKKSLNKLDINSIDTPIIDIIENLSKLSYCFTLQSCYGHFVHNFQKDPHSLEPLPMSDEIKSVEYRIAYIAFCIENSDCGKEFFNDLKEIQLIDTQYIQFGSAEWFWKRHLNSFILQVEPERYMMKDKAFVDYNEALHLQKTRNSFFAELRYLIQMRF